MFRFAAQNKNAYTEACRFWGLKKAPWPGELERLYPAVPELLCKLSGRYSLGILANQERELMERLEK